MFNEYIQAAITTAKYEVLDDGSIYAEIPDCLGVFANSATFEQTRTSLIDVLEGWLIVRLRLNLEIPVILNVNLNLSETEVNTYLNKF